MMYGKFTENETGVVCDVQSVFQWEDCPMMVVVTYPVHGKQYGLTVDVFQQHFTMVSPQELQARAFGAVDERPTEQQLKLQRADPGNLADSLLRIVPNNEGPSAA